MYENPVSPCPEWSHDSLDYMKFQYAYMISYSKGKVIKYFNLQPPPPPPHLRAWLHTSYSTILFCARSDLFPAKAITMFGLACLWSSLTQFFARPNVSWKIKNEHSLNQKFEISHGTTGFHMHTSIQSNKVLFMYCTLANIEYEINWFRISLDTKNKFIPIWITY